MDSIHYIVSFNKAIMHGEHNSLWPYGIIITKSCISIHFQYITAYIMTSFKTALNDCIGHRNTCKWLNNYNACNNFCILKSWSNIITLITFFIYFLISAYEILRRRAFLFTYNYGYLMNVWKSSAYFYEIVINEATHFLNYAPKLYSIVNLFILY